MDDLEAMLAEKDLVADKREVRGLVRGFTASGVVKLKGFETFERSRRRRFPKTIARRQAPTRAKQTIAGIEKSSQGSSGQADRTRIRSVARTGEGSQEWRTIELKEFREGTAAGAGEACRTAIGRQYAPERRCRAAADQRGSSF